jgi:uncharacterized membrane protein YhaH (DUF805 family)
LRIQAGAMDLSLAWYFLSLKGRISRQEFWLGQALLVVLVLLLQMKLTAYFLAMRQPASGPWNSGDLAYAIAQSFYFINAIMFWPVIAIVVKRLHDLDLSGWWVLVSLALCYVSAVINNCSLAFLFATTVMLAGLPPGTPGRNRFGADPLAPQLA